MEFYKDGFMISDKKELIDVGDVYSLLSKTYWASTRTKEIMEKSIQHSLSFGVYEKKGKLIGFARVVTDKAVFSWILDAQDFYRKFDFEDNKCMTKPL
ncbi:hypothetical protein [Bacillus pinisoli]|uniref:hypothetical protein n=1 Tax=Bacillus pinisoli TaxID=2901866 RepID=UPI003AEF3D76